MADTTDTPTTIAILHEAYERADAAYLIHDNSCCKGPTNVLRENAMGEIDRQLDSLRTAICLERPTNLQDALILSVHASTLADMQAAFESTRDEWSEPLKVATENIVAFLSREANFIINEERWMGRMVLRMTANETRRYSVKEAA